MADQNIRRDAEQMATVASNISKVFVGKESQIHTLLVAFSAGLHVLIEDVPGVGKTTLARCLAASVGLDFGRIQFTPDLLPGDITGMTVWSPEKREFLYKEGALMHQFVLADEINRASPRTQSSLLEVMQEGSVTVDGTTHKLPQPFFVIATQNPTSFLGAFPLPEGELDRFGVSFSLGYPGGEDEMEILSRFQETDPLQQLEPVTTPETLLRIRESIRRIHVSEGVKRFIADIASETRSSNHVKLGMSPRASQHLMLAAQGEALFRERDFVIPEDVLDLAPAVLAHRLILSAEARMENIDPRQVVARVLGKVKIPTGLNER
ncbi:MAG: MoxR family ATPase [Spirochaetaceae bacterium]|nr:MAG: MoxR family ATPase [Spirochaetaceae bacterium]